MSLPKNLKQEWQEAKEKARTEIKPIEPEKEAPTTSASAEEGNLSPNNENPKLKKSKGRKKLKE